jgi:alkylated DNA repair dioxygenase AlkB
VPKTERLHCRSTLTGNLDEPIRDTRVLASFEAGRSVMRDVERDTASRSVGPASQFDLFSTQPVLPAGMRYEPEFIPPAEEAELVCAIGRLPLKEFEFHGFLGKRRVISFGARYDFGRERLDEAEQIPEFLHAIRERAAAFGRIDPGELRHVLLTEYGPGAAIGWHKDKAVFEDVIGISLKSPCDFRLRRSIGGKWERVSLVAEPRSIYLLSGAARAEWEHSIPPVQALRFSITFRSVRHRCAVGDQRHA